MVIDEEIKLHAKEAEDIIYKYLPKEEGLQKRVFEAMNYSITAGGKRLRPVLMLETYRLFGGIGEVIEPFMAAIEMIHTYSLIHDDLPALDNDDYRRGRKTSHVVFGEAMAILAGDALLNYAYETACKAFDMNADVSLVVKALQVLASKPGVYGMIGGQVLDVLMTGHTMNEEQLYFVYENKTGALIEASMVIGAILAGADDEAINAVSGIASDVGHAFQIQDDLLDILGDSSIIGKPVRSDMDNGKVTYVTVHGIEKAQQDVRILSERAVNELEKLGYRNDFLKELIISLVSRQS